MDRPKMHIWGPDGYKKIYADEFPGYQKKGYRDHPNKVGQPLERPVAAPEAKPDTEAGATPEPSANAFVEGKDKPKRAYKRKVR